MPSLSDELIAHLHQNRATLRQAVDSIPASLRERRPGADRWSVAEVLEHLAIVEKRLAKRMADALNAAKAHADTPGLKTRGSESLETRGSATPAIDRDQVRRLSD